MHMALEKPCQVIRVKKKVRGYIRNTDIFPYVLLQVAYYLIYSFLRRCYGKLLLLL